MFKVSAPIPFLCQFQKYIPNYEEITFIGLTPRPSTIKPFSDFPTDFPTDLSDTKKQRKKLPTKSFCRDIGQICPKIRNFFYSTRSLIENSIFKN